MTDLLVRWEMGDFKKWGWAGGGGILVMGNDFEMGGLYHLNSEYFEQKLASGLHLKN